MLPPFAENSEATSLDVVERELALIRQREDERDRSVQSRLIAFMGLSGSFAAILSSAAGLGLKQGTLDLTERQAAAVLALLAYVGLQVVFTVVFANRGLHPRGFEWVQLRDLTEDPAENSDAFRARLLSQHRNNLAQNTWATNRRYDEMILARAAFRNAVVGTGLLLAVLLLATISKRFGICIDLPGPL